MPGILVDVVWSFLPDELVYAGVPIMSVIADGHWASNRRDVTTKKVIQFPYTQEFVSLCALVFFSDMLLLQYFVSLLSDTHTVSIFGVSPVFIVGIGQYPYRTIVV